MTTFAASKMFWSVMFSFSCAPMNLFIYSLISRLTHSFFSRIPCICGLSKCFLVVNFKFYSVVIWKYAWYDLNVFVLVEAWFVIQYVICTYYYCIIINEFKFVINWFIYLAFPSWGHKYLQLCCCCCCCVSLLFLFLVLFFWEREG